jgi:hypothetical protein
MPDQSPVDEGIDNRDNTGDINFHEDGLPPMRVELKLLCAAPFV